MAVGEGEPVFRSAITALDGYAMTKLGRAGVALTIAAAGSFIGGSLATVGLVFAAKPLAEWAEIFAEALQSRINALTREFADDPGRRQAALQRWLELDQDVVSGAPNGRHAPAGDS